MICCGNTYVLENFCLKCFAVTYCGVEKTQTYTCGGFQSKDWVNHRVHFSQARLRERKKKKKAVG